MILLFIQISSLESGYNACKSYCYFIVNTSMKYKKELVYFGFSMPLGIKSLRNRHIMQI